jgi:SAM-dependent methyltransferase
MDYDEIYENTEHVFGPDPEDILAGYYRGIDRLKPVLDIGAGQGRNALFLAREGYVVDALDPSKVALDALSEIARHEDLTIRTHHSGFESFQPRVPYSGILLFGLIPEHPWGTIEHLLTKIDTWSFQGTILFVTAFTTDDPAFPLHLKTWNAIGKNSFQSEQGQVRTYLRSGELLCLFHRWSVVHYWEGMGPEHRHGEGPPERHGKVEAVFQRLHPVEKDLPLLAAAEELPKVGT